MLCSLLSFIFMNTGVTINTLCPLCDQPFGPRKPSYFKRLPNTNINELPELLAEIWPNTEPRRRATNIHGRSIRSGDEELMEEICSLHRYETGILPLAYHYNWPRRFDPDSFLQRLASKDMWFQLKKVYARPSAGIVMKSDVEGSDERSLLSHRALRPLLRTRGESDEVVA